VRNACRLTRRRTELLDQLLVLVERLQAVSGLEVDALLLGALAVVGVAEDADAHRRTRDVVQPDLASEALVLLRVIVLQADLQLDRLGELALALVRAVEHRLHARLEVVGGNLTARV
jgi:hypothetical protein